MICHKWDLDRVEVSQVKGRVPDECNGVLAVRKCEHGS
jgi:hypothetical protein